MVKKLSPEQLELEKKKGGFRRKLYLLLHEYDSIGYVNKHQVIREAMAAEKQLAKRLRHEPR